MSHVTPLYGSAKATPTRYFKNTGILVLAYNSNGNRLAGDFYIFCYVKNQFKSNERVTMKEETVAPIVVAPIIITEWKLGSLGWSPKWKDSVTGKRGSAFYYIQTGSSHASTADFTDENGETTSITANLVFFGKDVDRDNLPSLQFNGGKAVHNILPETMMVNINKNYTGTKRYMPVEVFDAQIAQGNVITEAVDTSVQLPS